MALCFMEASTRFREEDPKGFNTISKQQYLESAIAHLRGARHPDDGPAGHKYFELLCVDPWMAAMIPVAIHGKYTDITDDVAKKWYQLLDSCMTGNLEEFKSIFESMDRSAPPDPLQPAAALAAQHGYFDIVRYCVERGAEFLLPLEDAAHDGVRKKEDLEYLYEQDWCEIRTSKKKAMRVVKEYGEESERGKWLKEIALPPKYKEVDYKSLRPSGFQEFDENGDFTPERIAELEEEFDIPW